MKSVIQDLQSRGLIAQTTDIEALDALLNEQKISLYCGFDPTADSLHIGHFQPELVELIRRSFLRVQPYCATFGFAEFGAI